MYDVSKFETIHLVHSSVNFFMVRYLNKLMNSIHSTAMFENVGPVYMILKTN